MNIPSESLKRLGKSVGVEISDDAIPSLEESILTLAEFIADGAVGLAKYSRRATILPRDIGGIKKP